MIKFIRIFLLVLIIIGIGLLLTQKIWVPKLVDYILSRESPQIITPDQNTNTPSNSNTNNISEIKTAPEKMTLDMKTWSWEKTIYNNDTEMKPLTENKFTIKFNADKTFSATTDCNSVGGGYIVDGNKISFDKMMSTMMYCEFSQEADFTKMLTETQNFLFTSNNELVLTLKFDSGSVFFR